MTVDNKALVLDLLEWIGVDARDYAELMEAWRTSCPRLPIWEDAVDHGFVACGRAASSTMVVRVTPAGRRFLEAERPALARREG